MLPSGDRVLDVGCGTGLLVESLRQRGTWAVGVDPATRGTRVEHQADRSYGVVISREVLEHLSARQVLAHLRELVRVCRIGGRVYITTRYHSSEPAFGCEAETPSADPTHVTCLPMAYVRSLLVMLGCVREPTWELALDWQRKGRVLCYRKVA